MNNSPDGKARRLHIWEHPNLHADQRDLLAHPDTPVEVIWEPGEYDSWYKDAAGDIVICKKEVAWSDDSGLEVGIGNSVAVALIPRAMYAKVWEETIQAPVGRATVPVAPDESDTYGPTGTDLDMVLPRKSPTLHDDLEEEWEPSDEQLSLLELDDDLNSRYDGPDSSEDDAETSRPVKVNIVERRQVPPLPGPTETQVIDPLESWLGKIQPPDAPKPKLVEPYARNRFPLAPEGKITQEALNRQALLPPLIFDQRDSTRIDSIPVGEFLENVKATRAAGKPPADTSWVKTTEPESDEDKSEDKPNGLMKFRRRKHRGGRS